MPNTPPALISSGNVYPNRFITVSGDHSGAQAGANAATIGISRASTNYAPLSDLSIEGYHAVSGQPISMIGDGEEGLLEIGDTVTAGALLKSDANGKGVPIASSGGATQNVGAIALEGGASGTKIRVQVRNQRIKAEA